MQSRKAAVQTAQQAARANAAAQLQSSIALLRNAQRHSLEALSSHVAGKTDAAEFFMSAFRHATRSQAGQAPSAIDVDVTQLNGLADAAFSAIDQATACLMSTSPLASAVNYVVKVFKLGHLAYVQGLKSWQHFCNFLASARYKQRIVEAMPSLQKLQEGFTSSATAVFTSAFNCQDSVTALQNVDELLKYRRRIDSMLTELGHELGPFRVVAVEFNMVNKFILELSAASSHYVATQHHVGRELLENISQV